MSLVRHLESQSSPVRMFFSERFNDANAARRALRLTDDPGVVRGVITAVTDDADRKAAWRLGSPIVLPVVTSGYPWPTVGTAFDYRLRFFFEVASVGSLVANHGARKLAKYFGIEASRLTAVSELSGELTDLLSADASAAGPEHETALAKACYVLALYEQCRRAAPSDAWPLVQAGPDATLGEIYALCEPEVLEDLTRLPLTISQSQATLLATRPYVPNPTFGEGSLYLGGADADLIVGDRLIDIKTTTNDSVERRALWQIVGYSLTDFYDEFLVREVGLYYSRHGVQVVWSLEDLLALLSGEPVDLEAVRVDFRKVLEVLGEDRARERRERIPMYGWTPPTRDRSTETLKRVMTFRPPVSGKGKWHVAFADNPVTGVKTGVTDPSSMASCGNSKVRLDVSGATFRPKKGHHAAEYADRLCARCLDYGGPFHSLANSYPVRVIRPREYWKFREPVNARVKWHIAWTDFYDEKRRRITDICNAGDTIKAKGLTIPVPDDLAEADVDERFCRHCILQARQALAAGKG